MTVICEKCGKSLEVAEAAFCPFCGAPVRLDPGTAWESRIAEA